MNTSDMRSAEKFIQDVAREAGEMVLKRFGKEGVHYAKSGHKWDVVTKADLASEKLIIAAIRKTYPAHGIIAEESGAVNEDAEYVWTVDPIDGTANFAAGIPMFGVMLCLVHRGTGVLSAVYLPSTDELFFAKVGAGAYLNGKRIHCSKEPLLERAFGVTSSSLRLRTVRFMRNLLALADKKHMMMGAFASIAVNACYVAAGRRDWFIQPVGAIWDFAPVALVLSESGCKVTDTKGKTWKFGMLEMVAANPRLHKQLLKLTSDI
jgi:myo-inositol-1(or 4)-monophosphatase